MNIIENITIDNLETKIQELRGDFLHKQIRLEGLIDGILISSNQEKIDIHLPLFYKKKLDKLSFKDKINILSNILIEKKVQTVTEIETKLDEVRQIRNLIAHSRWISAEENSITFKSNSESQTVDYEYILKFNSLIFYTEKSLLDF